VLLFIAAAREKDVRNAFLGGRAGLERAARARAGCVTRASTHRRDLAPPARRDAFNAYVDAHQAEYVRRLAEFVAIPSVSADPARRPDVVRAVHHAKAAIEALGGTTALHDVGVQPDGLALPPILTASLGADPAKKTVLVYGHLDVQPAAKADGWATEPFVLTEKDGKLFGRGSTDDKGPVLAWLAAAEAFAAVGRPLPVNLRFCLEAMEESGSEGLEEFLASKPEVARGVDYTCISDNYWLSPTTRECAARQAPPLFPASGARPPSLSRRAR